MAKIKAYTDLEQSKKLAEILPLESADMSYSIIHNIGQEPYHCNIPTFTHATHDDIPCWSLAALYGALPTIDDEFEPQLHRSLDKYRCTYEGEEDSSGLWRVACNPIDACYEVILKLHEQKLL